VMTAACESKRETALITSINEKDITYLGDVNHMPMNEMESKKSNDVDNVRHTATRGSATTSDHNICSVESDSLPVVRSEGLHLTSSHISPKESIDQFNVNLQPVYKLRRSASENLKPAYKLRRNASSIVRPGTLDHSDKLLPFCLQPPDSSTMKYPDYTVSSTNPPLADVFDEKKEEHSHDEVQYSENSNTTNENKSEKEFLPQVIQYEQNQNAKETRPIVVKPVARKPYVRPVPIKPLVKSLPIIPFGRTVSDPTSTTLPTRVTVPQNQINEGAARFRPRAIVDAKYATLELPRLANGVLEPVMVDDHVDSASESSEFSDGVTLDMSIADVSNLTNPTALISKLESGTIDEDQNRSGMSDDERPSNNRDLQFIRKKRDVDLEAKQSEASSSQTSEAAAPLLARAMRTFPLSDEISTDSFFKKCAITAKQQWNTRLDSNRNKSTSAPFEEKSKDDDSHDGSDLEGIWDIRQVESLFPTTPLKKIDQGEGQSRQSDWQPFPLDFESDSPKDVTGNLSDKKGSSFIEISANYTTPSLSKTPTRRNTSRTIHPTRLDETVMIPTLQDDILETTPMKANNVVVPVRRVEDLSQPTFHGTIGDLDDNFHNGSESSYPLQSTTSSNISGKTNRTVVSHLLLSSMSGTTSLSGFHYNKFSTTNTAVVSTRSTASSSTVSTYGPRHSALLARIHALKESRLRRATRLTPQNRRPSTALAHQASIPKPYDYSIGHTNIPE
jgi:hypothetical protein